MFLRRADKERERGPTSEFEVEIFPISARGTGSMDVFVTGTACAADALGLGQLGYFLLQLLPAGLLSHHDLSVISIIIIVEDDISIS